MGGEEGRRGEEWAGERSGQERGGVGRREEEWAGEEGRGGGEERTKMLMLTKFYCISVCVGDVLYSHETCVFTTTLQLPSSEDSPNL